MTPQEFQVMWNGWTIDQRVNWMKFSGRPDLIPGVVKDYVRSNYGAFAAFLDHPEVGPILMKAGSEGWAPEKLAAELSKTTWWKTTSAPRREWEAIKMSDPATAQAKIQAMSGNIEVLLKKEGMIDQYTPGRIAALAEKLLSSGADESMIPRMVLADVHYNPTHPVGEMGQRMTQYQKRSREYAVNLSDRVAFAWSKRVAMGLAEEGAVDQYLRERSLARYARNADITNLLNQGLTVREVLDDPINEVAKTLEIDADTIDLTSEKWSPIAEFADESGTIRPMTATESIRWARSQDEWWDTTNGVQASAGLGQFLGQKMGVAAE